MPLTPTAAAIEAAVLVNDASVELFSLKTRCKKSSPPQLAAYLLLPPFIWETSEQFSLAAGEVGFMWNNILCFITRYKVDRKDTHDIKFHLAWTDSNRGRDMRYEVRELSVFK